MMAQVYTEFIVEEGYDYTQFYLYIPEKELLIWEDGDVHVEKNESQKSMELYGRKLVGKTNVSEEFVTMLEEYENLTELHSSAIDDYLGSFKQEFVKEKAK